MHPLLSLTLVIALIIGFIRLLHWLQKLPFLKKSLLANNATSGIQIIGITKIDDHYKIAKIRVYGEEKIILLGPQNALLLGHNLDFSASQEEERED